MHCTHCGELLADNAKFCTFCGKPVQPSPTAPAQDPIATDESSRPTADAEAHPVYGSEIPSSYSAPQQSYRPNAEYATIEQPASNGLAIAGFVCSLIILPPIDIMCILAGLILSIIGLNDAKKLPGKKGYGLALAGVIISVLRIALLLILLVAFLSLMIRGIGYLGNELFTNWPETFPSTF